LGNLPCKIKVISYHQFWDSRRGKLRHGTIFGFHSSFFVHTVPGRSGSANQLGWICTQRRIRMILEALIIGIYPLLSLAALFALRQSRLTGIPQVLWAFLIVVVPVLGALAFFIVNPSENISS
jgi:hypothetical protein